MYEAQIIGESIAGEATQARKQFEQIIDNSNKAVFDLGEIGYKIKKNGWFHEWGFSTASEYFDTLPIKKRKIQYAIRIALVMEAVGISREQYEPVGIGKLRDITSLDPNTIYVNPQTQEETPMSFFIQQFVEKHTELSPDEIAAHVRTLKGLVGDEDFCFFQASIKRSAMDNVVRPALERAKNMIGSVGKDDEGNSRDASDGAALEHIAADFNSDPANCVLPESEE